MNQRNVVLSLCVTVCGLMTSQAMAKGSHGGEGRSAYRSAKSGQYVQKGYAQRHQSTTVRESKRSK